MALRYGLFCCMDNVNICDAAKTANLVLLFTKLFFFSKEFKMKASVHQSVCLSKCCVPSWL